MMRIAGTVLGVVVGALVAGTAHADTYVVNSTADAVDAGPGNGICATAGGVCTLRAAVQEANAHGGPDVVSLPAGVYVFTLAGAAENLAATGDLDVTEDLEIAGAGATSTIVDAAFLEGHFEVGDTFTIRDVTLRHGQAPLGGAIAVLVANPTTIERVVFENNRSTAGPGGAVFQADGPLTINESAFERNTANGGGGAVFLAGTANLAITNSTFTDNAALSSVGGAVFATNTGTATVTSCMTTQNVADTGGGMFVSNFSSFAVSGSTFSDNVGVSAFGGLFAASGPGSTVTATDVTAMGNFSGAFGGAYLVGDTVQVTGGEMSDNVGVSSFGGLFTTATTALGIDGTTFRRNAGGVAPGGGLYAVLSAAATLTLANLEVSENAGGFGGGLQATSSGSVSASRLRVVNNGSSTNPGGGAYIVATDNVTITDSTISGNIAGSVGGGLFVTSGMSTTLQGTTGAGNRAAGVAGFGGGGYFVAGVASTFVNSTFSGNVADVQGGAIYSTGDFALRNLTLVDNDAPTGSAVYNAGGTVTPTSTIVAGAALSHCAGVALVSGGNNIDSTGTCGLAGVGDQIVDPQLGPLADNGGATLTHLPAPTSPALDTGAATGCPVADQRGQTRPADGNGDGTAVCDVGAVEFLDLCLADPAKVEPGICGCGVADTDANFANGTADCLINGELKARIARAKTIIAALAGDADPLEAELGTIGESLPAYVSQYKAQLQLTDPNAKVDKLAKKAGKKIKKVGKAKAGKKLDKARTKATTALDALDAAVAPQA